MADDHSETEAAIRDFLDAAITAAKVITNQRMTGQFRMLKDRMAIWEKAIESGDYEKFPALFVIVESEFEAKCATCGLVHEGGLVPSAIGIGGCLDPKSVPEVLEQIADYLRMSRTAGLN